MPEILAAVCELMTAKAAEVGVLLAVDADPDLAHVVLDAKAIQRCVLNLVSNALDAFPALTEERPDRRVHAVARGQDDEAFTIAVSDNGVGIPDEAKPQLFDVFFSTKGSNGTGFGLAVTHKIMSEHGGTIGVESEEGRGAAFTPCLPRRPPDWGEQ